MMEVSGKIKKIFETKTYGTNGFRKREVVITTNEQYPQMILVEFTQDRCDLLNSFKENEEVTISINIRGREWINPEGEAKYFNSINGWRIQRVAQTNGAVPPPPEMPPIDNLEKFEAPTAKTDEAEDDLPF